MGNNTYNGLEIAVIGMACRFPGANNLDQFWHNLKNNVESVTFFTDEELLREGVPEEYLKNDKFVRAGAPLDQFEYFDERFFGYSPRDAKVMDPQVRLFHECAWEAFENAGYIPDSYPGLIGVFAGASSNYNWNARVFTYEGEHRDLFSEIQLSNKDFLTTRISYKFNLRGPSVTLNTSCSTSLAAIHMACRSLLSGECDMALAGGVSVLVPHKVGYLYEEGLFFSKDGHIRAFDADGTGIIFGSGVGAVVLKPLENALADKDHIWAIIRGSAVNNDGNRKVGYMAPSVDGQADVIKYALQISGVEPQSISYIETHGTGTQMGDMIEINALKKVFEGRKTKCYLGTVKTNIGHLDAAAGVAGFIKTVLSLKNRQIPPVTNFRKSNPNLELEKSIFEINTELVDWENSQYPLRAGVSSFGIGGANAHLIVEEAPKVERVQNDAPRHLVVLSGQTEKSLEMLCENLVHYLKEHPEVHLSDVAYTLQAGRKPLEFRKKVVCKDKLQLIKALSDKNSRQAYTYRANDTFQKIVFMFAGQGSQYLNMGRELYENEPLFRKHMDRCFDILNRHTGIDARSILFPAEDGRLEAAKLIAKAEYSQSLLFIFEYSLAQLLMEWGIVPDAVIGYSLGEYVGATVAGLFSLEQAIELLTERGRLFNKLPDGMMLSIPLPSDDVIPLLHDGLEIAIDNEASCVVGGAEDAVLELERKLKERKCICTPMKFSKVIHTSRVSPILNEYRQALDSLEFRSLDIPYISSVTGDWATFGEIASSNYWINHLKGKVNFIKGIKCLGSENSIFIEIGPGHDLSALVKRTLAPGNNSKILNMIPFENSAVSEHHHVYSRIGSLWQYGVSINWDKFNPHGMRIPMPTYPFQRKRFWLDNDPFNNNGASGYRHVYRNRMEDWYYIPSWKRFTPVIKGVNKDNEGAKRTLIFSDGSKAGLMITRGIAKNNGFCICVTKGREFKKNDNSNYEVNPGNDKDYEALFQELKEMDFTPQEIIHLWSLTPCSDYADYAGSISERLEMGEYLDNGYYSLLNIAKEIGKHFFENTITIKVISNGLFEVVGNDLKFPEKSTIIGPVRVIPVEYPNVRCNLFDIGIIPDGDGAEKTVDYFIYNLQAAEWGDVTAYKNNYFWVPVYDKVEIGATDGNVKIRQGGKYLIAGGLGGIALSISKFLAQKANAELILVSRSAVPEKEKWDEWLQSRPRDDESCKKIKKLREIEDYGGKVHLYSADIGNEAEIQALKEYIDKNIGVLDGIINAAGVSDGELIQRFTRESSEKQMKAKVKGTYLLYKAFENMALDFFILFSSLSSIVPTIGQAGYCAANSFLDAFAIFANANGSKFPVMSVNWERWANIGMSVQIQEKHKTLAGTELNCLISEEEGIKVFSELLGVHLPQVIVSAFDFENLIRNSKSAGVFSADGETDEFSESQSKAHTFERPDITTEYAAPVSKTEKAITKIWENQLGINQIGINDSFFELGGDSLMALSIQARIHKKYGVRIPMSYFFNNPTAAGISAYLDKSGQKTDHYVKTTEEKRHYCLSSIQKRVYFLQKMNPSITVYNNPSVYKLDNSPDIKKMNEIFNKIIQRHEILRTSFNFIGNDIMQTVHDRAELTIQIINTAGEGDVREAINSFVRPFELEKAPLLRVGFIPDEKILLIDMHHLVSDEMSYTILLKDFMRLYNGEKLPELKLQYKDYAQWQSDIKISEAYEIQKKYWLDKFLNDDRGVELNWPTDFKKPKIQSFDGDFVYLAIERRESEAFKRLVKKEGATLYMGVLAVYAVLVSKICQQECIIIGTPVSGRKQIELENVIGAFVDTIALKIFVNPDASFKQFLQEIKNNVSTAFDNQDYPFEELINDLGLMRDLSRNPLFETMFSYRDVNDKTDNIDGVSEITAIYKQKSAMFPIRLTAWESDGRICIEMEYCTKLFKESTIQRFAAYFENILRNVISEPAVKLEDIDIMTEEEKRNILFGFNQTQIALEPGINVVALFERKAEEYAEKTAVICGNSSLSYCELNQKANQLANYLVKNGVSRGTAVGIYLERSLEMAVVLIAVLKAGGYYVPIDPGIPFQRVLQIKKEVSLDYIISDSGLLSPGDIGPCKIIYLDAEKDDISQEPVQNPNRPIDPLQSAYVLFTSGSTGTPKGVIIPHRALVNFLLSMLKEPGLEPEDKLLSVTTISFDIFGLELYLPLIAGASVVLAAKKDVLDGKTLIELLEAHDITVMQATPAMWKMLILSGWTGKKSLKALCGGEALTKDLAQELLERTGSLWNMYGPTETTIWSSVARIDDADCITIGKPIFNTQMYILDEKMKPVPQGAYGELYIGGLGVATGYLNDSVQTKQKFINNPFDNSLNPLMYKTGDMARFMEDGSIEFAGRRDGQVKLRGFRIELSEIEMTVSSYPGVKENVVTLEAGSPEQANDGLYEEKYLACYIVHNDNAAVDLQGLKNYLLDKLPAYMLPQRFYIIDKLPLNANGKIDRKALSSLKHKPLTAGRYAKKPESEVEKSIAAIWERILGRQKISTTDSFFDLGGSSITVVLLQNLLDEKFSVKVNITDIFSHPTIGKLAGLISQKLREGEDSGLFRGVSLPPGFFLRGNDQVESIALSLELSGNISKGLFHIASANDLKVEQVILSLFMFLLNQVTHERNIEIYIMGKNSEVYPVSVDFSNIADFNSLFALIKGLLSRDDTVCKSLDNIHIIENYSKKLFLLFPLVHASLNSLIGKFNTVLKWKVNGERIFLQLEYDSLVLKGSELKKVLGGFVKLLDKFISRATKAFND